MASSSLQQPPCIATLSKPTRLEKKPLLGYGQSLRCTHFLGAPKLRFLDFGDHASAKLTLETAETGSKKVDSKVQGLAFVAGATGKVGSPTVRYEDLKPPSSPSPSAPKRPAADNGSEGSSTSVNGTAQAQTADKPSNTEQGSGSRPKPLSPFTMHEDLKPPTSPIPPP